MKHAPPVSEAQIFAEVVRPKRAAKSILQLGFDPRETARIRSLIKRNNRRTLSAEERLELEKYLRVGQSVDLLQAKARLASSKNER